MKTVKKNFQQLLAFPENVIIIVLFYFISYFILFLYEGGGGGTFRLIASKFFKYIFSRNCREMYIK